MEAALSVSGIAISRQLPLAPVQISHGGVHDPLFQTEEQISSGAEWRQFLCLSRAPPFIRRKGTQKKPQRQDSRNKCTGCIGTSHSSLVSTVSDWTATTEERVQGSDQTTGAVRGQGKQVGPKRQRQNGADGHGGLINGRLQSAYHKGNFAPFQHAMNGRFALSAMRSSSVLDPS